MRHTRYTALVLAALAGLLPAAAAPGAIEARHIERHVQALTALPHRLAGSAEGRQAGDYIIRQLSEMGFADEDIAVQPFPVVQIVRDDRECYLEVDGRRVPVEPIRPNGLALPVTPAEGIEGPTLYLGAARSEDLQGKDPNGCVAVMDFAAGARWLDAIRLGAKAIIFIGPDVEIGPNPATNNSPQWLTCHFPAARVFLPREQAERAGLLRGARVRLFVRMGYRSLEGRNIMVTVAGTEPPRPEDQLAGQTVTPVVAVAAAYDTFGPVPFVCPSTRKAANVAGLLELARHLRQEPPPVSTSLIFFDNNAQIGTGQLHFHLARTTANVAGSIEDRHKEAAYLRQGLEVLDDPDALIRGVGGTHMSWRYWLPRLLTGLSAFGGLGLLAWLIIDAVRWHGGLAPGWAALLRLVVLGGAVALLTAIQTRAIDFQSLGLGATAAAKITGSHELQALTEHMTRRYDDQRELLTSLRLSLLDLSSEVRDAVKGMRTQIGGVKSDLEDAQARRRAESALSAVLETMVDRTAQGSLTVAERLEAIGPCRRAADEALTQWRRSLEGQRLRNEPFIKGAHENLLRTVDRLIQRGPDLERRIEREERQRLLLGLVRLGIGNGRVSVETRDSQTLPAEARQEALHNRQVRAQFEAIIQERRDKYHARLAEIEDELTYLQASRQLHRAWSGHAMKAMLYLNLAPMEAAWAPAITLSDDNTRYVFDQNVYQWTHRWMEEQARAGGLAPHVARLSREMTAPDERLWHVSAQATQLVPVCNPGTPWPNESHPSEPSADVPAFTQCLREAEVYLRQLQVQPELHAVRPPSSIMSYLYNTPQWDDARRMYSPASTVRRYGGGSPMAEALVPNAVVLVGPMGPKVTSLSGQIDKRYEHPDMWRFRLTRSTQLGTFMSLSDNFYYAHLAAVLLDDRGRITHISQLHPGTDEAKSEDWNEVGSFAPDRENRLCMFEAAVIPAVGMRSLEPKEFKQLWDLSNSKTANRQLRALRGEDNVPFARVNLTVDRGAAALYLGALRRYKLTSYAPLMLNNSPQDEAGVGYPEPEGFVPGLERAAQDLWELNQGRLGKLERYGIFEQSLSLLHGAAERHLGQAELLDEQGDHAGAEAHRLAALQFSNLIYEPTRATTNDLIQAVVILLLLAVPFSFAVERVLSGSASIYRQIGGFGAIFLSVFLILYFVHPAFRFATFPMLVLLAFVIIILSGLVIAIMKSRFEYEVKKLQGIATASHRSTRNARQTISAAVAQGIASMRRRPVRTLLTALTIILLTFTIMFFGSFTATGDIRPVFVGVGEGPPRVEIALSGGRPLDGQTTRMLRHLWKDRSTSFLRQWETPTERVGLHFPALMPDGQVMGVAGFAVLDPCDIALYPALKEALSGDIDAFSRQGGVLVPRSVFDRLGLPDDGSARVGFQGRWWPLRGWFDSRRLEAAKMADGASFVPPDIEEQRRVIKARNPGAQDVEAYLIDKLQLRLIDPAAFSRVDPEQTIVLSDPHRREEESSKGVVLLAGSEQDAQAIAREAATLLDEPVLVVAGGRIDRVFYTTKLAVTGFRKLVIPLILGGLIIFSTMLASVTDRRREVFTLSALGLAPVHVAILFFAEAAVYSVIGGMAGYLLSQAFGKTVELMARAGWLTAPQMNYSSMNAMFSILLVMATVLISTVYPAFKAARSANPGIQRRWRMPKPNADAYDIHFPFTVSARDMIGLISFLEEYFLSHADRSVGAFAADQVRVEHRDGRFALSATVWLQPFDQGICQTFALQTIPSDIEGIDEIEIRMRRLAGAPAIWQRSANTFIDDIRQQFIFWRTIDEDSVDHYHQRTVQRFALAETSE